MKIYEQYEMRISAFIPFHQFSPADVTTTLLHGSFSFGLQTCLLDSDNGARYNRVRLPTSISIWGMFISIIKVRSMG